MVYPSVRLSCIIRKLWNFRVYRKYSRLLARQRDFIKAEIAKNCQETSDASTLYITVLVAIWSDIRKDLGIEEVYLINKINETVTKYYSEYDHFYTPSCS